jgi:Ser/Thr protein kinase RdoA (MazF antagonist)
MDVKTPIDRINYSGDIAAVINELCELYGVGSPKEFHVMEIGYEDCNLVVQTPSGKYLAKIFSKVRSPGDVVRYTTIMEKALQAGVNHPALMKTGSGKIAGEICGLSMVLMKFIEGKTFLDMDRLPTDQERGAVLEQAALVNSIDYRPTYFLDSWAIPNIKTMLGRVEKFILPDDRKLVRRAVAIFDEVPMEKLPACFVHGDFTKANVLKGNDGKIYMLDFSVANWSPRIQELAVISANLLYDKSGSATLKDATEIVALEYGRLKELSAVEKRYLYPYALAGVAMEFMGAHQEKHLYGSDTPETDYWMNLGRNGLKKELSGI